MNDGNTTNTPPVGIFYIIFDNILSIYLLLILDWKYSDVILNKFPFKSFVNILVRIFYCVITYPADIALKFLSPIYCLNTSIGERVPEAIIIDLGPIFYRSLNAKLGSKHFIYN